MNPHDRLRRNLREALPLDAGFPDPRLMDRVRAGLPTVRRTAPRSARQSWLPALVALAMALVAVDALGAPASMAGAGRVEFLSAAVNLGHVEFVSSQAQPADEYRAMTRDVLAGFNGRPDFNSQPTAADDVSRIQYEQSAGRTTIDLVALADGDLTTLQRSGSLQDLTPLLTRLQHDRSFPPELLVQARLGGDRVSYVPWLQATYMLTVNRQALQYLPEGADPYHLTYDDLVAWGGRMRAATGRNMIGLPADVSGPRGGLIFRFLQGYTYPSYTGATLTGFRSPAAVSMWQMLQRLWKVTDPDSARFTDMSVPLLSGDVWVAWDHQARLDKALADEQDFIALPAPSGPAGLGYLSVLIGLAIPAGAPNKQGAEALIDWLTRSGQQAAAASNLGFFPAVRGVHLAGSQQSALDVASTYQAAPDRIPAVLPVGLGGSADAFNKVYQDTFARIVLNGEDIVAVLNDEAAQLQQVVDGARAPCWPPDPPSHGEPCQIT